MQLSGTGTAGYGVSYSFPLLSTMRASPTLTVGTPTLNLNAGTPYLSSFNSAFLALQLSPPANGACGYTNTYTASADL
jgi:hypothetical protein